MHRTLDAVGKNATPESEFDRGLRMLALVWESGIGKLCLSLAHANTWVEAADDLNLPEVCVRLLKHM